MATVLGFLLVVAVSSARAERRSAEPRRSRLVKLIEDRRTGVEGLDGEVRALRRRVDQAEANVNRLDATDRQRTQRLDQLAAVAGTTALAGPGVSVQLSDSIRQPATPQEAGAFRIHDVDLQLVVNALFAAGAEAVSVNGNRLVATTPIRAAGDTIVVNFRPLNTPYEVRAIGARMDDFEQSEIATRFRRWQDLFGLGFSVRQAGKVADAARRPRHHRPPTSASASRPGPGPDARSSSLLAGAVLAVLLRPTVPQNLTPYVAIGVVVAIDSAFGGLRSYLERTFNDRVFVLAFVSNAPWPSSWCGSATSSTPTSPPQSSSSSASASSRTWPPSAGACWGARRWHWLADGSPSRQGRSSPVVVTGSSASCW